MIFEFGVVLLLIALFAFILTISLQDPPMKTRGGYISPITSERDNIRFLNDRYKHHYAPMIQQSLQKYKNDMRAAAQNPSMQDSLRTRLAADTAYRQAQQDLEREYKYEIHRGADPRHMQYIRSRGLYDAGMRSRTGHLARHGLYETFSNWVHK